MHDGRMHLLSLTLGYFICLDLLDRKISLATIRTYLQTDDQLFNDSLKSNCRVPYQNQSIKSY